LLLVAGGVFAFYWYRRIAAAAGSR
jgi:hypothetical protein